MEQWWRIAFFQSIKLKMAEADNLEYYIKFPNPNFNYNNGDNADFLCIINKENVPVVILFGWAGAKDKYLSVYSRIYEEKGLITLRYISPVKYLFWNQNQLAKIGEKLVKLLNDLSFENHPIIIHIFSNGGAFQYQFFSEALKHSEKPMMIKGMIFDSAPARRRILSMFRAIRMIKSEYKVLNFPISILIALIITTMWFFDSFLSYFFNKTSNKMNPYEYLKNEKFRWPQHFIYSKSDPLIPFQDVEYFASYRKSLGVDVTLKCYENTAHVRHFQGNESTYTQSIIKFMNKCLYSN